MFPAPTLPWTGHTGLGHRRFFNSAWPLSMKELRLSKLGSNSSTQTGYGLATNTWLRKHHYFGWLEDEGTDNEHFHFQVRRGHTIRLEEE